MLSSQLMTQPSLLIIGYGDLGSRVQRILGAQDWQIQGTRRSPAAGESITMHAADYTCGGDLDFVAALRPDYVLTCFNPTSRDLEGYRLGFAVAARNVLAGLGKHRPRQLIVVSSTRVYAETDGGWVDETAALSTQDERALAIIDAERSMLDSALPASIVRFGGLYGSANRRLIDRAARGDFTPATPVRYSNRMHRDDAAGFLAHLLVKAHNGQELAPVYNGVDDDPAAIQVVEAWLAGEMGIVPPPADAGEAIENAHATGKRCQNRALHDSGYSLQYPDFRAGYAGLVN